MEARQGSNQGLTVLAADEDEAALARTAAVLESLGHRVTSSAVDLAEATEAIAREDPDLSVVLVHDDHAHALELIEEINSFSRGPVIALVGEERPAFLAAAADRGIAAYTRGLDASALQAAIEVACRRHAETERLSVKVDQLQTALDRRSVIERAKGIIMERHDVAERGAFELLRAHARSQSRAVVDIAREVTEGADVPRSVRAADGAP